MKKAFLFSLMLFIALTVSAKFGSSYHSVSHSSWHSSPSSHVSTPHTTTHTTSAPRTTSTFKSMATARPVSVTKTTVVRPVVKPSLVKPDAVKVTTTKAVCTRPYSTTHVVYLNNGGRPSFFMSHGLWYYLIFNNITHRPDTVYANSRKQLEHKYDAKSEF